MSDSDINILVVDDNPINVKLLGRTLSNNNFNVLCASSGKESIDIAQGGKPDLILLDVLMPEMDGYEVCKVLKEKENTKHIPIIFLSAKNESVDKAKGLALGAADYLTKPFDPVEIIARIRTHLNIRKDVIQLRHLNEKLKAELLTNKSANGNGKVQDEHAKFLDKIKSTNYREANKYFRVISRVKFSKPPVTTTLNPVYLDNQNFIYLLTGGFEKDYKTASVQLLLGKYACGYFEGLKEKSFNEKQLYRIFDMFLESFSPDIYDAAFTISLGHLNATKNEFLFYGVHQAPPNVLDDKNNVLRMDPLPIFYESKYARIITAHKIKLPLKATLINYLSGPKITARTDLENMCLPYFNMDNSDLADIIEDIFSNLPVVAEDQLIMALKTL